MKATFDGPVTKSMESRFFGLPADQLMSWASEEFEDSLAVSTSFGIQSAVTLHLATSVRPDIPVIWVDTGYLPKETYQYAVKLTRLLNLNLQIYESPISPKVMEAEFGRLWESDKVEDLNRYDQIRKVEPMQRALRELNVRGWVSGLRADQTDYRKNLFPVQRVDSRYRIYPILQWNSRDIYQYMQQHRLPQHPLFEQGYVTVGDAHSSRPLSPLDSNERNTRFRGLKQECGIHLS